MGMLGFSQMLITKAFWAKLINLFVDWVGNYGWAIILLTIALKLVLTPLDILQKRVNKKNAQMQAIMQPELRKIQEQYPGDRNKINQKQMELAKKYNFNMTGTCVTLLVTMIVSLVIFSSLFIGLNSLSKKQESVAFNEMYQTYTVARTYTEENVSEFADENAVNEYISAQVKATYKAQSKKYSFLWVKNVWKKDTSTSPVVSYSSFENYALKNGIIAEDEVTQLKADYDVITSIVESEDKYNGCYILIILAGLITFITQFLQSKIQQKRSGNAVPANKTMLIVMPLFMLIFASTSSALFTLYIITNSLISAVISTIIDLCQKPTPSNPNEIVVSKGRTDVVEYSRNYKKG